MILLVISNGECFSKEARDVTGVKPTLVYCSADTSFDNACAAFGAVYSNRKVSLQSDELMAAIIYAIKSDPTLVGWQRAALKRTLEQKQLPIGTVINLEVVAVENASSVSEIHRITLEFGCAGLFDGVALGRPGPEQEKRIFTLIVRQIAKMDK